MTILSKYYRLNNIKIIFDLIIQYYIKMENTAATIVKDKIIEDKQRYWDSCAKLYDDRIMLITYQSYITLAIHTEVQKCEKILELAIGTGTHTLHLANTLLKKGGTIVCTEIS